MFLDDSLFFRKTALLFLTVWISVKDDKTVVGGGGGVESTKFRAPITLSSLLYPMTPTHDY